MSRTVESRCFDPPAGPEAAALLHGLHSQVLSMVDASFARAAARGPTLRCGAKCAQCCIDGFQMSRAEASYLSEGLSSLGGPERERIAARLEAPSDGTCVLLQDHLCSVYAHRPIICRLFGLLLIDEAGRKLRCELNFVDVAPGDEIAAIDLEAVYGMVREVEAVLYPGGPGPRPTVRQVAEAAI